MSDGEDQVGQGGYLDLSLAAGPYLSSALIGGAQEGPVSPPFAWEGAGGRQGAGVLGPLSPWDHLLF